MENLTLWSERMRGAISLLLKLQDNLVNLMPNIKGAESKVYSQALYECLYDVSQMENFILGGEVYFFEHKRDKNGKLISCKARIQKM